jgi:hypothetical protein
VSKSLKDVLIKNKKTSLSLSSTGKNKKKNLLSTKPFNKQDNKSPNGLKGGSKIQSNGDRQSKSQPKDKEVKSRSGPRSDDDGGGSSSGSKQQKKSFRPKDHHKAKRAVKKPLTPAERKALKPHFKLVSVASLIMMMKHILIMMMMTT